MWHIAYIGSLRLFFLGFIKYFIVGGAQFVLDVTLFVIFSFFGVNLVIANVASRFLAAVLGYFLNRRYTFGGMRAGTSERKTVLRYWFFWGCMTLVSTHLIKILLSCCSHYGLSFSVKIPIELALCVVGYIVSKLWVFSHDRR